MDSVAVGSRSDRDRIAIQLPVWTGLNTSGPDLDGVRGGVNPLFFNGRDSTILYNFIRKEKISNAINNCYQVKPLFQKFLDPALYIY